MAVRTIKHLVVAGDPAQTAELHGSHWLAKANEVEAAGGDAEPYFEKSQEWLDRANVARGWN